MLEEAFSRKSPKAPAEVRDETAAGATPKKSASVGAKKATKRGRRAATVSRLSVPDASQSPRKIMALGADVSGLGTPRAGGGRAGDKKKKIDQATETPVAAAAATAAAENGQEELKCQLCKFR